MKILYFLLLFTFSINSIAFSVDEDGNIIIEPELKDRCFAKGDVTAYTYRHRDSASEEEMLHILEDNWNENWKKNKNIKHATYIDMQRIIRDAYRTGSKGNFQRECCNEKIENYQASLEMNTCLNNFKF